MKRALVVGINNYIYKPEAMLRGCKNDALQMRAFMEVELGIEEIVYLVDEKAESQRIMDVMQDLAGKTGEGDYLALSWSSHGTQIADVDGDELDGYHEALCCTDVNSDSENWTGGFLLDKTLRDILKKTHPDSRVECWFDTCFSGGMKALAAMGMTYSRAKMLIHPGRHKPPSKRLGLEPPSNAVLWAACKEHQTSADAYISGDWHGAFIWHFLHGFGPDLTRKSILAKTKNDLSANEYDQVPQITYGHEEMAEWTVGE